MKRRIAGYMLRSLLVGVLVGIGLTGAKDGSIFAAAGTSYSLMDGEGEGDGGETSQIPPAPDNICKVVRLDPDYNPEKKQIEISWETQNAESVNVMLNDVEVCTGFTGDSCTIYYTLQAGADYTVTVVPIDSKGEEGEEAKEQVCDGEFVTPSISTLKGTYAAIKDKKGVCYGFAKPSVIITWEGQENAHYAIYRAPKDQQTEYTWVTTAACSKEGICTFTDENAKVGKNYYKICQVITADTYIEQEISTSLSSATLITMDMPKAKLEATQQEEGTIMLDMSASREYVTGYRIYRKNTKGKYVMIAETSSNTYLDSNVAFGKTYSYKVRCFYSDPVTGERRYGAYSKVSKVKNTVGKLGASVKRLSSKKVKISWNKAVNAKKYEVYYKTQTDGDSYSLLTTTKARSITKTLKKGNTYDVMIRAYCQTNSGKEYFSCAFVTFTMGFTAPSNEMVKTTSYLYNDATKTFVQKDTLAWERVYGASGYYVECYNPVKKVFEVVAKVKGSSNVRYTLSNDVVSNPVEKQYRISAYDKKNKTKTGKTINIIVGLDTVKGIKVKTSGTKAVVSWKGATGAQLYNIYRSNGRFTTMLGTTSSYSYTDNTTSQGVEYIYYVQAVNSSLNQKSALGEGTSYTRKVAKVARLKAVNRKKNKVKLTWPKQKASEGYIIYYRTAGEDVWSKLAELSEKKTSYTHTDLEEGETYYYRIVSIYHNTASVAAESSAAGAKVKVIK